MCYLTHQAYGLIIGPLQTLQDADVVILITEAENVMRIVQGYAYHFDPVVDGVIMTINPVNNKKQKEALLSRLETKDEL